MAVFQKKKKIQFNTELDVNNGANVEYVLHGLIL